MSRKTFSVETFKNRVNKFLATDEQRGDEARQALMTQLEGILHETGNYEGFAYLSSNEIDAGNVSPGINVTVDGRMVEEYGHRFAGTDSTRVKYF